MPRPRKRPRKIKLSIPIIVEDSRSNKIIGEVLREKRDERKLTQKELALLIGSSQARMCKVEKGEATLSIIEWLNLVRVLRMKQLLNDLYKKLGRLPCLPQG